MTLDTGSFDLKRQLPLDADTLWQILTDPHHREHWSAPEEGMTLTTEHSDLTVGGADRVRCGAADAPDFAIETRWYHLATPERAAFTETLIIGGAPLFTSLVTYVLVPVSGARTDLHITVALSSFCGPDALQEAKVGWDGGLANLERYIAGMSKRDST